MTPLCWVARLHGLALEENKLDESANSNPSGVENSSDSCSSKEQGG